MLQYLRTSIYCFRIPVGPTLQRVQAALDNVGTQQDDHGDLVESLQLRPVRDDERRQPGDSMERRRASRRRPINKHMQRAELSRLVYKREGLHCVYIGHGTVVRVEFFQRC